MVKLLSVLAPAKINLVLRITGRRPDGYHELDSVFLPITLFDRVALEVRPAVEPAVALRCTMPGVPADDNNLAAQAALSFLRAEKLGAQVSIDLDKNIPPGAGLGGGSSDAAAVLRMLAVLMRCGEDKLAELALKIGADVPFFLDPRPAHVTGIGDNIDYLAFTPAFSLVLALPPFTLGTASIYRALAPEDWSGALPQDTIDKLAKGEIGQEMLINDLEKVASRTNGEIRELKELLLGAGAKGAAMSGSGSAVFGIFADRPQADAGAAWCAERAPWARFVSAGVLENVPWARTS